MAGEQPYRSDRVAPLRPETDFFGHADYADALCREVKVVPAPFTLGFFAPWGTGKSTVLDETAKRLNKESDLAAVVFDVWKFEGDSLRREFVADLGRQLKAKGKLKGRFNLDRHLERFDADVADSRPGLKFTWRSVPEAIWRGLLAVAVVCLVLFGGPHVGLKEAGSNKLLLALASGLVVFVMTALAKTLRVEQVQVTRKRLQDPDEFAASFEGLLRKGLRTSRLIIAIDNLDRCVPARVTELLTTIKAFLEPVKTGKDLVFVVAADDTALRRHLVAQELAVSGGSAAYGDVSAQDKPPDQVQEAVDEYLRKFFNGTLRLTEVLDEDIRDFAAAQLKDFAAVHKLDKGAASQLTELVATALKQNPRRIKQFINGLELRLQLLEQRRKAKRIQIEPDILVVAKLAIIEEEWNDEFRALKRDPKLLAQWHDEARSGRDQEASEEYPRWQVFLRNTEQIRPPDLRPYITLKQTELELNLPRYQEFVDALEDGRVEALEQLLEDPDISGQRDDYIAAIPNRLSDVIRRNFASAAANIVRATIESELLHSNAPAVLRQALLHPPLQARLGELPPASLLHASDGLDDQSFNEVVGKLLDRFERTDEGTSEGRTAVTSALIPAIGRLDQARRDRITKALKKEEVRSDFPSYQGLAEADPALLPDETVTAALESLGSAEHFGPDAPAYLIATRALLSRDGPSFTQVQRLGEVVTKSLVASVSEHADEFKRLAEAAALVLRQLDVARTSLQEPVESLDSEWPQISEDLRPSAMDFVGALLVAGTKDAADQFGAPFVDRYFDENPRAAVSWAGARWKELPAPFTDPVRNQLATFVSGGALDEELARQATTVTQDLPKAASSEVITQAVTAAIEGGRYRRAGELINEHGDLLGKEARVASIERIVSAAESSPDADQPEVLGALSECKPGTLSADLHGRLADVVANAAIREHSEWRATYEALAKDPAFSDAADGIIARLFDHVVQNGTQIPSYIEQVDLVSEETDRLEASQVDQLGTLLVQAIQQAVQQIPVRQLPGMATALGRLDKADPSHRHRWVTDVLVIEQQQTDPGIKEALLRAAFSVAGRKNTNAWQAASDRLKQLRKGSDEEKELAKRVREDLP